MWNPLAITNENFCKEIESSIEDAHAMGLETISCSDLPKYRNDLDSYSNIFVVEINIQIISSIGRKSEVIPFISNYEYVHQLPIADTTIIHDDEFNGKPTCSY